MQNPFAPRPGADSYVKLKERIFRKIQAAGINDQVFETVKRAYEQVLAKENVVLSRPERNRLLSQILKQVLKDMLEKLDDRSRSA